MSAKPAKGLFQGVANFSNVEGFVASSYETASVSSRSLRRLFRCGGIDKKFLTILYDQPPLKMSSKKTARHDSINAGA
jgi:hypothetical protein